MSWILGIDTSSIDLGAGLYNDHTAVASYSRFIRNSHAEHIADAVDLILKANNLDPSQIDHIAVTSGPGSFTGLRIGLAFAKGFCFGKHDVRLLAVSSLEVMAHSAVRLSGRRIISAIDARNDGVFLAAFRLNGEKIERLTDDSLCASADFMNMIQDDDILITDTMGYIKSTVFGFLESHPGFFPVEKYPLQRGLFCAFCGVRALGKPQLWKTHPDIMPNYLRLSPAQSRQKELSS